MQEKCKGGIVEYMFLDAYTEYTVILLRKSRRFYETAVKFPCETVTHRGEISLKKWICRILLSLLTVLASAGAVTVCLGYIEYREALQEEDLAEKIAEIRMRPDYVLFQDLPRTYVDAVVAVEDHRFWQHGGMDLIAIGRAVKNDLLSGSLKEGGSTITQQLARNLYFTQEKKFTRKIAEIFLALKLERDCTKEEILELYVNTIYFGDGYYGIGEAASGYYGKEPKYLNPYESTMLAGLPNAPSAYALREHPDLAEQRRQIVVGQMEKYGYLSAQEERWLKGALIKGRPIRIFVYADMESKMARCRRKAPTEEKLTDKELRQKILAVDKDRAKYYEFFTGQTWGNRLNFDFCINTSQMVIKDIVPPLAKFLMS
ncbi:MAG TPA: transglycosylase domain-containing protein [Candidatus Scatomonas pullistercoris]|uniref:Penicillin-binding protein 1A n=1 Tax=Candidatus Scatomonas pullistercoris TaxID=2840920 RepID=A0A9D1TB08_9FIRM|nr:transglycosylase domain-containing protein [Candidatus Scatomonas pullistercoris]